MGRHHDELWTPCLTLDCHLRLPFHVAGFMHVHDFHHFCHANSQPLDNMLQQKTGMHQRTAPSLLHFDILTTLAMALIKCHVEFYFLDETQVLFELHKAERGSERELDKVVYLSCTYSGQQRACF